MQGREDESMVDGVVEVRSRRASGGEAKLS